MLVLQEIDNVAPRLSQNEINNIQVIFYSSTKIPVPLSMPKKLSKIVTVK